MPLFGLTLLVFCAVSAHVRQYTQEDIRFRQCCQDAVLDCAETSCYYQLNKNDLRPSATLEPLDGKDCATEEGFGTWRKCFIARKHFDVPDATNNTECCRPKGDDDALPKECLDLCDVGKRIGKNTAADYASCEEFRYRINCCNAGTADPTICESA